MFSGRCCVMPGNHVYGPLQNPFEHRCRGGDEDSTERNEEAYKNPTCTIVAIGRNYPNVCHRNECDYRERTRAYGPHSFDGRLGERLLPADVPQRLERIVERREKRNGRKIRIRQEWVFEIDLKRRGVRVSAFEVRLP